MNVRQFLLLIGSLSISYTFAQKDTTRLLYAKNIESNAFVEVGSHITQAYDKSGMDVNLAVNWLVAHKYYVGAAYSQLASKESFLSLLNQPNQITFSETTIKYQTLGLRFGYILFPNQKVISFSPDLTLAWAGVRLNTDSTTNKLNGAYISPALKGVFNISKYFRIGVALNYNIFAFKEFNTTENYFINLKAKELNGFGGGVFFRIGSF